MSEPKLVIVQETPKHIVEVRTGVMGKRGPKGDEGPIGPRGFPGPKGDPAKELEIVVTDAQILNISGLNHGIQYVTTNNQFEEVVCIVGRAEQIVEDEIRPNKGAVVLFTQGSEASLIIQAAPEVSIIVPKDCLPKAYGIGCSIGLIAADVDKWILVGDLFMNDIIIQDDIDITGYVLFEGGYVLSMSINGTDDIPVETVTWSWNLTSSSGSGGGTAVGDSKNFLVPDFAAQFNDEISGIVTITRNNGQTFTKNIYTPPS